MTEHFKINVREEEYRVELIDLGSELQYKVSTDCNYLMTIRRNEDGNWSANPDVTVLDKDLVRDIGDAIENRDA